MRQLNELTDILSAVTASDSDCELQSSRDECSDDELWQLVRKGNLDNAHSDSDHTNGNCDVNDEIGSNDKTVMTVIIMMT